VLLAVASACDAPSPAQSQYCTITSHSSSNSYEMDYQLLLPSPCPAPLAYIGEVKTAAGRIYDRGAPDFNFAELRVFNSQGVSKADVITRFVIRTVSEAEPRVSYAAGTGAGNVGNPMPNTTRDYGRFMAFNAAGIDYPNNPFGEVEIRYTQSPVVASIGGSDIPPLNTVQTWTAQASGGSGGYVYRWYRDGVAVSTGSTYTTSVGSTPFGLRLEASDPAQATGVNVMAVDVGGVRASMSGPTLVYASQGGGTWSVTGRGGTPPYTFQWFVDGVLVRTGGAWTGYPGEGVHMVHVEMRDTRGMTHSATEQVTGLGSGDGGCDPVPPQLTCDPEG
jgi:hypothetical protein